MPCVPLVDRLVAGNYDWKQMGTQVSNGELIVVENMDQTEGKSNLMKMKREKNEEKIKEEPNQAAKRRRLL
ncbi:hypothetical protein TYRP_000745 [Tyrophagus putrescentiae]|nr:hypothetical protein TYRP_000745 [Tyrophagus putrescentiae]